ncbi:hypothetical protein GA0115234_10619 [Streptomyces sp. DvalAA-43]|nr:hypothetical protein GA0115234_10619 [Streptomyces sp. DvalAA-43]
MDGYALVTTSCDGTNRGKTDDQLWYVNGDLHVEIFSAKNGRFIQYNALTETVGGNAGAGNAWSTPIVHPPAQ